MGSARALLLRRPSAVLWTSWAPQDGTHRGLPAADQLVVRRGEQLQPGLLRLVEREERDGVEVGIHLDGAALTLAAGAEAMAEQRGWASIGLG